jgi:hypothetical protein
LTANSRGKITRNESLLSLVQPGNPRGRHYLYCLLIETALEADIAKGLDWRFDYHIIKNSFKAATAGSGAAGKTWGAGGLQGENFIKNIDNIFAASYTYKVKIWAVLA